MTEQAQPDRPKVLIVDDRPDNLLALEAVIETLDIEIIRANSGEDALRRLLTDEVAVMYAGRVVERAPTRTLFHTTRMPYTEALLAAIPKLDAAQLRELARARRALEHEGRR